MLRREPWRCKDRSREISKGALGVIREVIEFHSDQGGSSGSGDNCFKVEPLELPHELDGLGGKKVESNNSKDLGLNN